MRIIAGKITYKGMVSFNVGSASFRDWFQQKNGYEQPLLMLLNSKMYIWFE